MAVLLSGAMLYDYASRAAAACRRSPSPAGSGKIRGAAWNLASSSVACALGLARHAATASITRQTPRPTAVPLTVV